MHDRKVVYGQKPSKGYVGMGYLVLSCTTSPDSFTPLCYYRLSKQDQNISLLYKYDYCGCIISELIFALTNIYNEAY